MGRVLVVGFGRSGQAAARLHRARNDGRTLSVYDDNSGNLRAAENQGVQPWDGCIADVEQAIWSPGIPLSHPLAIGLAAAGCEILSEVAFAAPDLPPVIGVTGTNGKSTVTGLLVHLISRSGRHAVAAGNIGTPVSEVALQTKHTAPEIVVLELSSYQLELPLGLSPVGAILTNLAPDHLDRYADVTTYYRTKWRLVEALSSAGLAVLPKNDDAVETLAAAVIPKTRLERCDGSLVDGWVTGEALDSPSGRMNLAQAATMARYLGIPEAALRQGGEDFDGLPHRRQVIGRFGGRLWIDDSKATNVAAVVAALHDAKEPVVILLGGQGKGEDYEPIADAMMGRRVQAICYGQDGAALAKATGGQRVETLAEAVDIARDSAPLGATILLAPACASFDQFTDYAERGRVFASLAAEGGGDS
ncbi:MAG: UDP-N-acetylmuramoyl-L-alanine--D-glutamate ligase [Myxococcota bacterium]|nr:UDP-N-acetylmuramoyl-L-alanine--D-glutamate ligase [Myxococcota bacterium]